MDWTLEVVILPVSDIDRSIAFYRDQVGFELDHDTKNEQMHVVKLTPRGSGMLEHLRRSPISEPDGTRFDARSAAGGRRRRCRAAGADRPGHRCQRDHRLYPRDGGTFFGFSDPDGNTWAVQELRVRGAKPLIPLEQRGRFGAS